MLHVRLDADIKKRATDALDLMGLSMSEAIRVFLCRVARDQAFPFAIKVPNSTTQAAMDEAERLTHTRFATSGDLFKALTAEQP